MSSETVPHPSQLAWRAKGRSRVTFLANIVYWLIVWPCNAVLRVIDWWQYERATTKGEKE